MKTTKNEQMKRKCLVPTIIGFIEKKKVFSKFELSLLKYLKLASSYLKVRQKFIYAIMHM